MRRSICIDGPEREGNATWDSVWLGCWDVGKEEPCADTSEVQHLQHLCHLLSQPGIPKYGTPSGVDCPIRPGAPLLGTTSLFPVFDGLGTRAGVPFGPGG